MYIVCAMRGTVQYGVCGRGADGGDGTNTKPGWNIHTEKIPEDTSVKTNSQDWSDRRWNRHCLWVSMPIFHLNFQSASLPLDHTMFAFVQFVPLDEARPPRSSQKK